MKKFSYDFVKASFEKEKYVLITNEYEYCKQKLGFVCPKGHQHVITFDAWNQGHRCLYCDGQGKPTINFIRSEFAKENYKLLTKEYVNSKQKLEYICPKGHKHDISWNKWGMGRRCPYCIGNVRLSIKFIRSEFEKEYYILLSNSYINASQKLEYICPNGHRNSINWNSWQRGNRCSTCFFIKNSGIGNPNWKGGIACEPYCLIWLDKEFKKSILERDNYECQNLDCWGTNKKLTVHHIDYDKKNCKPKNLITLCKSCNSRANSNRQYWQKLYENIIKDKKSC